MESYFDQRLAALGITPELNEIKLWQSKDKKGEDGVTRSGQELVAEPVFRKHEKGIEIIVYTLGRLQPTYVGESTRWKKNWSIVRYEKPIVKSNGDEIKYLMPKGQGSYPFFPPKLVDKFDAKQEIKTLFLTEGFFKAFKGDMHGIDIVGVASITHLKNKETGGLHGDIISLIRTCRVQRVVWLTDGDCLDVSGKALLPGKEAAEVDLYKRPASFYSSISTFKQLLDDYEVDKYFMHIDTDAIWAEYKDNTLFNKLKTDNSPLTIALKDRGQVKGLDDLLVAFPEKTAEIVEDIQSVSKTGFWFQRFNISVGMSKVRDHFRLHNVNSFILFHQERNKSLKDREFTFNGTRYRYIEEKGECDVMIPGDAKLYFRVGNDYYKWLQLPNQFNQLEKQFHERSKTTITDDHGKNFIKHIPKYEAFCNVPSHTNYQQVIHNCFNVYSQIDYQPDEQACTEEELPTIYGALIHMFGDREVTFIDPLSKERKTYKTIDLALDYMQINYLNPQQKLPILCLVSKENNTGKSTMANLLRIMLGANVAIVGNQDLAGDFNAHWSTKSVVVCDETKIDKQHVIEKIKSLSTARKIWVNAKGKGQFELDCFIKFVLITNNEENFIYAGDDDIRYWVIKVPVLKLENPDILNNFNEEMPAFLSFLSKRKLATEKKNRMWFHPELLKTEALKKVIAFSKPTIEKEIMHNIREKFLDFGCEEILMTLGDIKKDFFNNAKYESNYIMNVLKDKIKVDLWYVTDPDKLDLFNQPIKLHKTRRYSYPRYEVQTREMGKPAEMVRVDVNSNGRPYVFKREQFLSAEEIAAIHISPETKQLNDMSGEVDPPQPEKPTDLPF